MPNSSDSNSIAESQAALPVEGLGADAPSFPFLTKLWINGNLIAIIIGVIVVVGSGLFFGSKTDSGFGLFVGLFAGALYGAMIWFFIKMYSEIAGVWLNMEESTRITADILARMEAKANLSTGESPQ